MRKSPVKHIVDSYKKTDGTKVKSHIKGSGLKKPTPRMPSSFKKSTKEMVVYTGTDLKDRRDIYRIGTFFSEQSSYKSDAGDFGSGVYLDKNDHRASLYGKYIFKLKLDMNMLLKVKDMYDDKTVPIWLRDYMYDKNGRVKTIHDEDNLKTAKDITRVVLDHGYHGIIDGSGEVVLFSDKPIIKSEEVTKPNTLKFDILKKGDFVYISNKKLKAFGERGKIEHLTNNQTLVNFGKIKKWFNIKNVEKT
mgnify:CR=1 FL=1